MADEKNYGMQPEVLSPGLRDTPFDEKKNVNYDGFNGSGLNVHEAEEDHLRDVLDMEKRIQEGTAEREVSISRDCVFRQ